MLKMVYRTLLIVIFLIFIKTITGGTLLANMSTENSKPRQSVIDSLLLESDNVNIGTERMLALSRKALKLSFQDSYLKGQLHATYNIGRAKFYQNQLKDSFFTFDTLLNTMMTDSVKISKVVNFALIKSRILSMIAVIFQELNDPTTSMQYYFRALKLIENTENNYDIALICKGLGGLNMNAGNQAKAEEYFSQAIRLSEKTGDFKIRFDICHEQLAHYKTTGDYHKALELGIDMQNLAKLDKMPYMSAIAMKNLGEIYLLMNEKTIATSYLNNVVDNLQYNSFTNVMAECYTLLAKISKEDRQYDPGQYYAKQALKYADIASSIALKADALRELAEIQMETGQYTEASFNLLQNLVLRDSLNEIHNAHQVLILQSKHDLDRVMNDKRVIEDKLTIATLRSSIKNYMLIGSLIIILLMGVLILLQIRKRRFEKRMGEAMEQQRAIIQQQNEVIQKEKEENLKLELEHKNRELVTRAMILTRHQEETKQLIDDLTALRESISIENKSHRDLNRLIQHHSTALKNDNSEDFRLYFENVYSEFYNNLSAAYPNLTPHELKICAYLKLNLSTKDIATLTCREVRSIESTRNRLRKHLSLQPDVNLTLFLSKF